MLLDSCLDVGDTQKHIFTSKIIVCTAQLIKLKRLYFFFLCEWYYFYVQHANARGKIVAQKVHTVISTGMPHSPKIAHLYFWHDFLFFLKHQKVAHCSHHWPEPWPLVTYAKTVLLNHSGRWANIADWEGESSLVHCPFLRSQGSRVTKCKTSIVFQFFFLRHIES